MAKFPTFYAHTTASTGQPNAWHRNLLGLLGLKPHCIDAVTLSITLRTTQLSMDLLHLFEIASRPPTAPHMVVVTPALPPPTSHQVMDLLADLRQGLVSHPLALVDPALTPPHHLPALKRAIRALHSKWLLTQHPHGCYKRCRGRPADPSCTTMSMPCLKVCGHAQPGARSLCPRCSNCCTSQKEIYYRKAVTKRFRTIAHTSHCSCPNQQYLKREAATAHTLLPRYMVLTRAKLHTNTTEFVHADSPHTPSPLIRAFMRATELALAPPRPPIFPASPPLQCPISTPPLQPPPSCCRA